MTNSWVMNCFIVGCAVLLAYPAIVFIYRESKGKGQGR